MDSFNNRFINSWKDLQHALNLFFIYKNLYNSQNLKTEIHYRSI